VPDGNMASFVMGGCWTWPRRRSTSIAIEIRRRNLIPAGRLSVQDEIIYQEFSAAGIRQRQLQPVLDMALDASAIMRS